MDLDFTVQHDVLLITIEDALALNTRTYPVGDLCKSADVKDLVEAIETTVEPDTWEEMVGEGTMVAVKSSTVS